MDYLPILAPQDSYTLWYTLSHTPPSEHPSTSDTPQTLPNGQNASHPSQRRPNSNYRSPLTHLRLDEEYIVRRKANISNYGTSWIKPPGIPKSLFQLREEKREMEEHQEAMRREQLAAELAEAEAMGADEGMGEEEMGDDVPDLDDEVPEAEEEGEEEEEEEEEEEDQTGLGADSDSDGDENGESGEVPRGVLAGRLPEDVYREALVRGDEVRPDDEVDGEEEGEQDMSGMLQEEDLQQAGDIDVDMNMDADLDADVPEAAGYEHTDTEEELSSSSEEDNEGRQRGLFTRRHQHHESMVRSDGTQNSMDLGSMLSGSSQIGSSPQTRTYRTRRSGN